MTTRLQDLTPGTPEWNARVEQMEQERLARVAEMQKEQLNANMKANIRQRYKGFFDR